jgi:hypothetical protein
VAASAAADPTARSASSSARAARFSAGLSTAAATALGASAPVTAVTRLRLDSRYRQAHANREVEMDRKESGQLLGLASGSIAGSFVTNQTVISVIYDSMKVDWNNGAADPEHMPSTNFAVVASPAARGRSVQLGLRGYIQPVGAGSIRLEIGGAQTIAQLTEESFSATVTATLSLDADTTPVTLTLDLAKPADESLATLTLDSIDLLLPDCA